MIMKFLPSCLFPLSKLQIILQNSVPKYPQSNFLPQGDRPSSIPVLKQQVK